jgi:hypothetical protein
MLTPTFVIRSREASGGRSAKTCPNRQALAHSNPGTREQSRITFSDQASPVRIVQNVGRVILKRILVSLFGPEDVIIRWPLKLEPIPLKNRFQLPSQEFNRNPLITFYRMTSDQQEVNMIRHEAHTRCHQLLPQKRVRRLQLELKEKLPVQPAPFSIADIEDPMHVSQPSIGCFIETW